MEYLTLARVLHVLGVVLWIGGVALVAMVLLPFLRAEPDPQRALQTFFRFARRFAAQARFTTLLTGLSGLYMLYALDAWSRFTLLAYWWQWSMVLLWLIFSIILFVIQPLAIRRDDGRPAPDPVRSLRAIQRAHRVLLGLGVLTIAAAVSGAHGWLWAA